MKVSAKIDYACRALLDLALQWPSTAPVQIQEIAKRRKIPMKFLVHILISLKQLNLLESSRGQKGGYILTKSPQKIKLKEVIDHFGGLGFSAVERQKKLAAGDVIDLLWKEINDAFIKAIDEITLETLVNRERQKDRSITFEI